ncbi:MAG: hypothetical protein II145_04675 [Selenomonas sp.]|nr:hypothetical protein [Selenomonas sp.]MCI7331052.1 hypothetical protein [Selenomonadaceae bacterium]MDD6119038.1 hypothetical protein [Selenomonadaceae bacterium]
MSIASGIANIISFIIFLFLLEVSIPNIRGSWRERDFTTLACWLIGFVVITALLVMGNDYIHTYFDA